MPPDTNRLADDRRRHRDTGYAERDARCQRDPDRQRDRTPHTFRIACVHPNPRYDPDLDGNPKRQRGSIDADRGRVGATDGNGDAIDQRDDDSVTVSAWQRHSTLIGHLDRNDCAGGKRDALANRCSKRHGNHDTDTDSRCHRDGDGKRNAEHDPHGDRNERGYVHHDPQRNRHCHRHREHQRDRNARHCNADSDNLLEPHPYPDLDDSEHRNRKSNRHWNEHAHTERHVRVFGDGNAQRDGFTDVNGDAHADRHPYANTDLLPARDAYRQPQPDSDGNADTDTHSDHDPESDINADLLTQRHRTANRRRLRQQ